MAKMLVFIFFLDLERNSDNGDGIITVLCVYLYGTRLLFTSSLVFLLFSGKFLKIA